MAREKTFLVDSKPDWMSNADFIKAVRERKKRELLNRHSKNRWFWKLAAWFV